MIIPGGSDPYGQLIAVLMFMALLAYLAPGVTAVSPVWARYFQIVAIGCLAVAIVIAVIATIAWFIA